MRCCPFSHSFADIIASGMTRMGLLWYFLVDSTNVFTICNLPVKSQGSGPYKIGPKSSN